MPLTAAMLARALAVLLTGFLCVRGAVAVWQQWVRTAPLAANATLQPVATAQPVTTSQPVTTPQPAPSPPSVGAQAPLRDEPSARAAPTPSGALPWHAIERSAGFVEGHAGPLVAAFVDVDCGYCVQLWRSVRAPLAAGRLRVRWIPVAVLAPAGADRAAALLRAADPVGALAAHATRAVDDTTAQLPPAAFDDVAANNAMLAALTGGQAATPVLVARGAGDATRLAIGLPADLAAFLGDAR